ncbi:hypothetical protein MZK47_08770 [Microbacterium aerolatum]|uniref:hypothetical protein n=1 Tax=Microbacterium aerolatum TaxID=153731 RepID=UPI0020011CEE|nr:hypothetical protein [Microbacterium aerolatum]MCK3769759.1 hypothetical protein [Microbacterium aerolatum]
MSLFRPKRLVDQPDLDAPVWPPATPSKTVLDLQKKMGRQNRSLFAEWMRRVGWIPALVILVVVVASGFFVGIPQTGELLLGVASPHVAGSPILQTALRWAVSITGWLVIPVTVAGVTGYFISLRLQSFRPLTDDEISRGEGNVE